MLKILQFFPNKARKLIEQNNLAQLEEIRVRVNNPIILKYTSNEIIIDYTPNQEEIIKILQFICDNSIYSYQNQICNGFITIDGGHRVRNNWGCHFRR